MLFIIFKGASYFASIILHTSVSLLLTHCFGCQTMECWWKKMHKSVTIIDLFYGVSSQSCLSSHQPFYSPLKCHKAVLSLIFSFLLKTSNNLKFLPLFLVKILPLPHATNWILLETFLYFFFFNLTFSHIFVQGPWKIVHWTVSSLRVVIIIYSPLCIFDAPLIFFNVKVASKLT